MSTACTPKLPELELKSRKRLGRKSLLDIGALCDDLLSDLKDQCELYKNIRRGQWKHDPPSGIKLTARNSDRGSCIGLSFSKDSLNVPRSHQGDIIRTLRNKLTKGGASAGKEVERATSTIKYYEGPYRTPDGTFYLELDSRGHWSVWRKIEEL